MCRVVSAPGWYDDSVMRTVWEIFSGHPSRDDWHLQPSRTTQSDDPWIVLSHRLAIAPRQGWKLHVSATVASAVAVLHRVVPVLLSECVSFKVAASLEVLRRINDGHGGLSQIGKFITVYPSSDDQAVRLASALDCATRALQAPSIPSDRPLAARSLVHYRYGSFDDREVRIWTGEAVPAISDPDGRLVPDRRLATYHAPPWVDDPFLAGGIAQPPEHPSRLVSGGRYLIVMTLQQSARGTVHLAVDLESPRTGVLKRADRDACCGMDGRDARDRLYHEADVLARLAPDHRFPQPFGIFEESDSLYLAMQDFEGPTLEEHVHDLAASGRFLSTAQIVEWGRQLAAALEAIHDHGFVYGDVKSANVIVGDDALLRLVDFESARVIGTAVPDRALGTRGYASPQQSAGKPLQVVDDVYGLGALLYFLATAVEPSHAVRPFSLLDRPIRLVNPAASSALVSIIARCVDSNAMNRFQSMRELSTALACCDRQPALVALRTCDDTSSERIEPPAPNDYGELARRLGDTLCDRVVRCANGQGVTWNSSHPVAGRDCRYVNSGTAGTVLAIAELVSEHGVGRHRKVLADGARGLVAAPPTPGAFLPGLYVGEAGVGAALLRAGQVLQRSDLIAEAARIGRRIAKETHASPDMFCGTAGRLRFHLLLWDATGDPEHLRDAVAAGEALLMSAATPRAGELLWTIPRGFEPLSGSAYLGYAHGAAGMADALLDLFDATADCRYLAAAVAAGRSLTRLAVPTLDDESGKEWPDVAGARPSGSFWCRGAAGVGRFFLHLAASAGLTDARQMARSAATMVARGARYIGPTQCHGLAGNIEFLLDMFQATGESAYHDACMTLATLLEAQAVEHSGLLMWPSELPIIFSPDYMVGYAGVAVCLLRLNAPSRLPHQLSRNGFRRPVGRVSEGRGEAAPSHP